ncbi:aspartate aminotransferase [Pontibacter ummariensis]|uniref:Aminotransferase n=1 Tax=Pontibacter ummariensis TaxID=1610492 RepID=A0A239BHV8_9BACT|nr:pyridoxal phosphate-dependent aminotransferase [Pontibacter ummariensis]PRY16557.1 aspartate aminotransferase [Pontibacter ummariensis]SNS07269.1 aspartate aminotransferase [Pontibacter ummariensis]
MQDLEAVKTALSDRIQALAESQTIAMAKKARELTAQGYDVINLSFGEPDFQTPQYIKDAAKQAIDEGFTFYTPVAGYPELRQEIVNKFKRDNNLDYKPENIVVSTGAKQSIANAVMCLTNPGDEVIIFSPYWVSYEEIVKLAEGVPVPIMGRLENDYKVTAEQLEKAITSNTKLVMYSSPCNPTGAVFDEEELRAIAAVLEKHPQIYVIADEIYEYINFGEKHFSLASVASVRDRVVTVNGFSKGYAMTGWRVGYIAAHKEIAAACDKMQSQITSGTSSISQKAAAAALKGGNETALEMTAAYRRRRDLVLNLMQEIPGFKTYVPQGAFYIFPDVSEYFGKQYEGKTIESAEDLSMFLLTDANVALVSGEAFGAPQCIRFSFATSDEKLTEALTRIKNSLAKLQ